MTETTIHKFEAAGLGKAPFRFIECGSLEERRVDVGGGVEQIIPRGGSCHYCGTFIVDYAKVRSADGKTFRVGLDCAKSVGDKGLRTEVETAETKLRRAKTKALNERKANRLEEILTSADDREVLSGYPHPKGFKDRQTGRALTLLDWAEWMAANSGAAGRAKTLKAIEPKLK